ncbi:hypothetical protein [Sphingomonas sp. 28-62-11]|uniref:hypothetical protein n=1 Tax=Sphingomonas sp. 28-62-11 TaxID=1970432 RepID=UPI000BD5BBED|nr:MAG: hypothetical protein B7Y49_13775 [Sphingomonas sp. 28-62-11]
MDTIESTVVRQTKLRMMLARRPLSSGLVGAMLATAGLAVPVAAGAMPIGQDVPGLEGVTVPPVAATPTPTASPTRSPRRGLPPPDVVPEPELGPIGLGLPIDARSPASRGRGGAPTALPTPTPSPTAQPVLPDESVAPANEPGQIDQSKPESAPSPVPSPIADEPNRQPGPSAVELDTAFLWAGGAALVTLLLVGGLIAWRRRRPEAKAAPRTENQPVPVPPLVPYPEPAIQPPPPPPVSPPAPSMLRREPVAPPASPAIPRVAAPVLRPWLEIEFIARRAGTNLTSASVDFELAIHNIGTVAATDVRILVQLLTANPHQNAQLQTVFDRPTDQPIMAPFGLDPDDTARINAVGTLGIEKINRLELEGRPMFIPIMAVRTVYNWASNRGQPGATANAYILGVGREGQEKMQPLWLDTGPRMADRITYRLHEIGVRR